MKKLVFSLVFATLSVSANATCTETVAISSADELDAFRNSVNEGGKTSLCAVVTSDIAYTGGSSSQNNWTPIKMYEGTFDGQGHTISGLYYTAPKSSETDGSGNEKNSYFDAGFFANLAGNAVVKNLRVSGATFAADERVGGIVADVKYEANVVLENVSFSGTVTSVTSSSATLNGHFGGLIGTVSNGALSVTLKNCYSDGAVTTAGSNAKSYTSGGLIGSVFGDGTKVTISNCYSAGSVSNVASGGHSGIIIAQNSASVDTSNVYCTASTSSNSSYLNCKSTTAKATAESNFTNNLASQKTNSIEDYNRNAKGVTFSLDGSKLIATFTDDSDVLLIPEDIFVDVVVFKRKFTNNKASTVALPFYVSTTGNVSGASFNKLESILARSSDEERDTIKASPVTSIVAYKPYVVVPAEAEGLLTVVGSYTLKKTENASLIDEFFSNWQFITAAETKRWDKVGSLKYPEGNNASEIGRVYGFAGSNTSNTELGSFVRAVTNVAIKPMRAYLMYVGTLPENCKNALCKPSADIEPPESFVLLIETASIGADSEGDLTSVQKMHQIPTVVEANRWHDLNGRGLNKKPAANGVYINDRTSVIVK